MSYTGNDRERDTAIKQAARALEKLADMAMLDQLRKVRDGMTSGFGPGIDERIAEIERKWNFYGDR